MVPPERATRWRPWLIVGLTLLAFGLRLYRIDAKGIWWDESLSLFRASQSLPYILGGHIDIQGVTTVDQHPPLYFAVLHGMLRLAGESDLALRWASLLAATLIVPLLYALGSRMGGFRAGAWAALWGALSPFYLWYAQEARMYAQVTALGLAATYLLWRAGRCRRCGLVMLAYAVVAAAAMATHYMAVPLVATHILLALALGVPRRLGVRPRWLYLGAGVGGLAVAVVAPAFLRHLLAEPVYGRTFVPLGGILVDALNAYTLGLSVHFQRVWPWEVVYLAVFGVGVVWSIVEARRAPNGASPWAVAALLLGQILLPIGALWAYSLRSHFYMGSRYIMVYSPSFYLGLGLGMSAIGAHRRTRGAAVATALLGAVMVAGMGYSTLRYFTHDQYTAKEDHRGAAELVARLERPGDAIILTAPENEYAFAHYYRGALDVIPLPYPPLAAASGELPEGAAETIVTPQGDTRLASALNDAALAAELEAIAARYDRLWLVNCRPQWSDPHERVRGWLDAHLTPDLRTYLPSYGSGVTVAAYLTRSPVLTADEGASWAQVSPLADLDGRLALLEAALSYLGPDGKTITQDEAGDADAPVPGGRVLAARLTWRVAAPLRNVKYSLRLVDAQGVVWTQKDDRPLYHVPTEEWPVGAVVQHVAGVPVPVGAPPGRYALEGVFYYEDDLAPLPIRSGGADVETLRLGQVDVGRTPPALWPAPGQHTEGDAARRLTLAARWGALRLVSYTASAKATTDEPVELVLHAQFEGEVSRADELVVHWADADRTVRHRAVWPLPELPPGEAWRAGEPLTVRMRLAPPPELPPGEYSLHLLVHRREEGRYLALRRGIAPAIRRSLRLGTVRVACTPGGDTRAECR